MKEIIPLLLSVCTVFSAFAVTGCAAEDDAEQLNNVEIVLHIGDPIMTVNGEEKEIDPGMGTAPVIMNDRTLLPVRAIVEELGGRVEWDAVTSEVTLSYGDSVISLTIESTNAYLNGTLQTLDTAPVIINERTMFPIRFIAEGFDFDVVWDGDRQEVKIMKNGRTDVDNLSDMILIEGGTFTMGINSDEPERDSDEMQHSVEVSSFYMSPAEVSQDEYEKVMGNNPSENKGGDLPVENITWYEAVEYCNALSEA